MKWLRVLLMLTLMGAVSAVGYVEARLHVAQEVSSTRTLGEYITPQNLNSLPRETPAMLSAQVELPRLQSDDYETEAAADTALTPDQTDTFTETETAPSAGPDDSRLASSETWPDVVIKSPPEEALSVDQEEPVQDLQETTSPERVPEAMP